MLQPAEVAGLDIKECEEVLNGFRDNPAYYLGIVERHPLVMIVGNLRRVLENANDVKIFISLLQAIMDDHRMRSR